MFIEMFIEFIITIINQAKDRSVIKKTDSVKISKNDSSM